MFLKKFLMFTEAAFIWSKIQKKNSHFEKYYYTITIYYIYTYIHTTIQKFGVIIIFYLFELILVFSKEELNE